MLLFLSMSRGASRDDLIEYIWSAEGNAHRRNVLRQLVYKLRRLGARIDEDGGVLYLAPQSVVGDLIDLQRPDWPETAGDEALLASGSLLPGFHPEPGSPLATWYEGIANHVTGQRRRGILHRLSTARREARWHDVARFTDALLAIDPLNEEATLARAESLALHGSKRDAVALLERYREEMGLAPADLTLPADRLDRRIRALRDRHPQHHESNVPFVGRAESLGLLDAWLQRVNRMREPSTGVLTAPDGLGKTRLILELTDRLALDGWRTVVLTAAPGANAEPLALLTRVAKALLALPGALGAPPQAYAFVADFIAQRPPEQIVVADEIDASSVRRRLAASLGAVLTAIGEVTPVLLVIDDAQHMDDASLGLLFDTMSSLTGTRAALLLASWPMAGTDPLGVLLAKSPHEHFLLPPLTADETRQCLHALIGPHAPVGDEVVEDAVQASAGSPLLAREFGHWLSVGGSLADATVPFEHVVARRLAALSSEAREALTWTALFGPYATPALVASGTALTLPALAQAVRELIRHGMMAPHAALADGLHAFWATRALATLSPAERAVRHLHCARSLASRAEHEPSIGIASAATRHFHASGAHAEAISLAETCAAQLDAAGFPSEAAALLRHCCELAGPFVAPGRTRERLLPYLSRAGRFGELLDETREHHGGLLTEGSPHSPDELIVLSALWRHDPNSGEAYTRLMRCVDSTEATPGHRLAAAAVAALAAAGRRDFSTLKRVALTAQTLEATSERDELNRLLALMVSQSVDGDYVAAAALGEKAVALARTACGPSDLFHALFNLCVPCRRAGYFTRAEAVAAEAEGLAARMTVPSLSIMAVHAQIELCVSSDRLSDALRLAERLSHLIDDAEANLAAFTAARGRLGVARTFMFASDVAVCERYVGLIDADLLDYDHQAHLEWKALKVRLSVFRDLTEERDHLVGLILSSEALDFRAGGLDAVVDALLIGLSARGDSERAQQLASAYLVERRELHPVPSVYRTLRTHLNPSSPHATDPGR